MGDIPYKFDPSGEPCFEFTWACPHCGEDIRGNGMRHIDLGFACYKVVPFPGNRAGFPFDYQWDSFESSNLNSGWYCDSCGEDITKWLADNKVPV